MSEPLPVGDAPVLALQALNVTLGQRPVLHDIDLEISAGEICVLVGPNGAGKTTLMRAACGLLRPASGTVRVLAQDPARSRTARGRIGLVPQEVALYDHLTVRENLFVLGRLSGLSRADLPSRVSEAMDRADLTDRAHDKVATLSGGYQRRANIACALLHRPAFLILDEPTVAVDQEALGGVLELIGTLRSDGIAILVSTHELDRAERLADTVAILVAGRLRAVGSPEALIEERYGHRRRVTIRLASAPMPDLVNELTRAGLAQAGSEVTWHGLVDQAGPNSGGPALGFGYQELIADYRLRRPGLDTLYTDLCGREDAP